jgi:hypothetical protein
MLLRQCMALSRKLCQGGNNVDLLIIAMPALFWGMVRRRQEQLETHSVNSDAHEIAIEARFCAVPLIARVPDEGQRILEAVS